MKIIIVNCKKSTERESMIKLLQTRAGQNTLLFSSHAVQNAVVKEKFSHMSVSLLETCSRTLRPLSARLIMNHTELNLLCT